MHLLLHCHVRELPWLTRSYSSDRREPYCQTAEYMGNYTRYGCGVTRQTAPMPVYLSLVTSLKVITLAPGQKAPTMTKASSTPVENFLGVSSRTMMSTSRNSTKSAYTSDSPSPTMTPFSRSQQSGFLTVTDAGTSTSSSASSTRWSWGMKKLLWVVMVALMTPVMVAFT